MKTKNKVTFKEKNGNRKAPLTENLNYSDCEHLISTWRVSVYNKNYC